MQTKLHQDTTSVLSVNTADVLSTIQTTTDLTGLCVNVCDKHSVEQKTHTYTVHTAAVFTYSSLCLLFKPQLVFSTPGPSLWVDSLCGQRARRSCQCSDLRGRPRVNKPWGHLEHERRKLEGHRSEIRTLGFSQFILRNQDRTRHFFHRFAKETIQRSYSTTWHNVRHLHRHAAVSQGRRCVTSSCLVWWEENRRQLMTNQCTASSIHTVMLIWKLNVNFSTFW